MGTKKTIFSGMQATGAPSLGSLLGAIRHWTKLSKEYDCLYCVVDLHSITIRQDPKSFLSNSGNLLAWLLACGLDPNESTLYFQSHVSAHSELAWILNCFTYTGELNRMTQFKEKSARHAENVNAGLYTYPVLQAADILLFQSDLVPVGEDQRQHLELSRDIAIRFNNIYGDIFTVPEAYIADTGARIMGLQTPEKKMSKSDGDNDNNIIFLTDTPNDILRKFKRAITDSDNQVRVSHEKPGVSNLLTIYACATERTIAECEAEFDGISGYGELKKRVGEAVVAMLSPYQTRYAELIADVSYIDTIAKQGSEKAKSMAHDTLLKAKNAIGFLT